MNFFRRRNGQKLEGKSIKDSDSAYSLDNKSFTSSCSTFSTKKNGLIKWHTPFNKPLKPIKKPQVDLSSIEQEKYDKVLEYFKEYIKHEVPINELPGAATHPILSEEKAWLTQECLLRYLRATKWKTDAAIKRLEETIIWRRTFGLIDIPVDTEEGQHKSKKIITPDLVSIENESGKNIILGYDNDNRPCLLLRNGYQNTETSLRQVQLLVFMLESVIKFMPPGQDTLALLIDLKAAPAHLNLSSKLPSISICKQVLHILQHHYPERLGRGLFANIPWIGYTFLKLVGPFVDPHTELKTIYDQPFELFVPKEQLDKEFNGMLDFEYIHKIYWPQLNEMVDRKHDNYMTKFHELGGDIGLSEFDLRVDYDKED